MMMMMMMMMSPGSYLFGLARPRPADGTPDQTEACQILPCVSNDFPAQIELNRPAQLYRDVSNDIRINGICIYWRPDDNNHHDSGRPPAFIRLEGRISYARFAYQM